MDSTEFVIVQCAYLGIQYAFTYGLLLVSWLAGKVGVTVCGNLEEGTVSCGWIYQECLCIGAIGEI